MKLLSPTDQLFLWLEKRQQPMHVAGLQLFSFPDDAGDDYVAGLAEFMASHTEVSTPFNQRLSHLYGQMAWVPDKRLDLEHHFRFEALPTPGRIRELLGFVSAEHSHLMDRERPLWECHLVEGLKDRQFAIYSKVHHSLLDGVSAMRAGTRMLSTDASERDMPPFWALPAAQRSGHERNQPSLTDSVVQLVSASGKQLGTVPTVARELMRTIRTRRSHPLYDSIFHAPRCILNQSITGSRRFAAQSFSMERIRKLCNAYDATVNDIISAMSASALRQYLINHNALPDRPLIALIPVSLHRGGEAEGNQIAVILASLGTHLANPQERLQHIQKAIQEAKDRYAGMSSEEIVNYTALSLAPAGFQLLTGLAPKWQTFNVVISNVPGPKEPLYWNGARLQGQYPVSIVLDRMALNFTVTSYDDQIDFGVTGCRRTVPSLQRMLDYLDTGLAELEEGLG